jgi:hypothetical protein
MRGAGREILKFRFTRPKIFFKKSPHTLSPHRPGSEDWIWLFGNLSYEGLLQYLNGHYSWNEVFGWLKPSFFKPGFGYDFGAIFSWLAPDRLELLSGGRFDIDTLTWFTRTGVAIRFGTDDWKQYFGNLTLDELQALFPNGGRWDDYYGWITPFMVLKWHPGERNSKIQFLG